MKQTLQCFYCSKVRYKDKPVWTPFALDLKTEMALSSATQSPGNIKQKAYIKSIAQNKNQHSNQSRTT